MEQDIQTKHIKIWGVRVYIINRSVTRNKLDEISHHDYCMGYAATSGIVFYWKPDQTFVIHKSHYISFYEYNYYPFITPFRERVRYAFRRCLRFARPTDMTNTGVPSRAYQSRVLLRECKGVPTSSPPHSFCVKIGLCPQNWTSSRWLKTST